MSGQMMSVRIHGAEGELFGRHAFYRFMGREIEFDWYGQTVRGEIVESETEDGGAVIHVQVRVPDAAD